MDEHYDVYRIPIDGRWSLEDLYVFPRAYEQVYFAFEAVAPMQSDAAEQRIRRAFAAYPWQGGYSAVSFNNQLKYATPPQNRPTIQRFQYSSPGVIDLLLNLPLAIHIGAVVTSVSASILACNKVYNTIHTDLQKRKLLRLEVERKRAELTRDEFDMVMEMSDRMAKILDIRSARFVHERTGDPLKSLKILLSVYRRVRTLAAFKIKGKADLRSPSEMIHDGDF